MTTDPIARAALATPRAPGAIAAIHLAGDINAVLENLGVRAVTAGAVALRDVAGIDTLVVAMLDEHTAILTPHGGPAVVDAILEALSSAGVEIVYDDPRILYPEAEDEIEAIALHALARATSPRATALLLDQPRRWHEDSTAGVADIERISAQLKHLITPPTVVAAGPPNIGKSTLLNALAGRTVSVVADEPGVTRDNVGALLELDGMTVRWIDAPGIREPEHDVEARAIELVKEIIRTADLVLLCGDTTALPLASTDFGIDPDRCLTFGLRADRGEAPDADLSVSAVTGAGISELATTVRNHLVPDSALEWPGPWRFAPGLPPR